MMPKVIKENQTHVAESETILVDMKLVKTEGNGENFTSNKAALDDVFMKRTDSHKQMSMQVSAANP